MPFFPTGLVTGGPYQPLNTNLTQISAIVPGLNSLMQYKGSAWASRTLTQVWADFMADPGVASYAYTALPFTISADKRLLGRDSALAFQAQEISIGTGLTLASGVLSLSSSGAVTSLTGTANQVLVNGTSGFATAGAITLTLPQDISTTSIGVTFGSIDGTPIGVSTRSMGNFTALSCYAVDDVTALYVKADTDFLRLRGYSIGYIGSAIESVNAAESAYTDLNLVGNSVVIRPEGSVRGVFNSTGLLVSGSLTTAAPIGSTARPWKLGDVSAVSPTAPNRTVAIDVNGTVLYLHAKTTND